MVEPFVNRVFIEERGQFADKVADKEMDVEGRILFALENAEFNAYFTDRGVNFQFAERKVIPKGERVRIPNEPEERGIETTWHSVRLNLLDADPTLTVTPTEKVHEYYNYSGIGTGPNINFVPAFKELVYMDVYPGIDMVFELPDEGGIKYRFEVAAGVDPSVIRMEWLGIESLASNADGGLSIKSRMALMKDAAPTAHLRNSGEELAVGYSIMGLSSGSIFRRTRDPSPKPLSSTHG